jgi:hypothetical protein
MSESHSVAECKISLSEAKPALKITQIATEFTSPPPFSGCETVKAYKELRINILQEKIQQKHSPCETVSADHLFPQKHQIPTPKSARLPFTFSS